MSIDPIKTIINSLPESNSKKVLTKKLNILEKDINRTQAKYLKANEDKLTISHLLAKVNRELEESLDNEKRFIASVSHELRTPLTAILGYSELLDDTALNNKQKRYLTNIVQSSDHLLALISDLLDVAKLEDNRIELSLKEFDLDDILNECSSLIQSKIANGVEFFTDIPLLDYPVISDDKRVKQIFINLLSNASKFTKRGSIRFYIKNIEEMENNKVKLVINVDDTGDGIPKEVANTLFEPFQSTDKTQGTGLGLYISQQLARLMDGEIVVESKIGVGSSFSVTIVVEKSAKKEVGKDLKGANIMMFADKNEFVDRISKEFMGLNVNFQNYSIVNSDITTSLVQMIVSGRFYDMAVFDIDVFQNHTNYIAGTLKAINPDIKIVALVSEDSDKHLGEFDEVIHKPIPYQRFVKQIESIYSKEFFGEKEEVDYSKLDILIVEDVELNREYEKEMLNNFFSISCDTAVNGQDAVEKVRDNNYDAVLMDMRMPVMDGLEATREIRKFNKDIPIICMSANVYKEDKLAAQESGMDDFIEKPLEKRDIENKLIKLINNEFIQNREIVTEPTVKTKTEEITEQKVKVEEVQEVEEDNYEPTISGIEMKEIVITHLESNFNTDIANKLFLKAMDSVIQYVNRIEENFKTKDIPALVEDFHILKGVCSNIGLHDIASRAGELQKLSENGDFLPIFKPKNKIVKELKLLINEVK
jgi:signal transduction histidine kinase/CheY-like chemotaxis protein/HPt (histidine-containing phosphotransfer) domain-containing protein